MRSAVHGLGKFVAQASLYDASFEYRHASMQPRLNHSMPLRYSMPHKQTCTRSLHTIRKHAPSPRTLATTKNRSSFSFASTAFGRALAASEFSIISAIAKHSMTTG